MGDARLDDHEFVATQAADEIVVANGRAHPFGDGCEQGVAGRVPMRVVHLLETVEIDEMHGHACVGGGLLQLLVEKLANVEAVGRLGQRAVVGEPGDALGRLRLVGDVLLDVDPAAVRKRLVGDEDDAPVAEPLRMGEGLAALELGDMPLNPAPLLLLFFRRVAPALFEGVIGDEIRDVRARPRQVFRQLVDLSIDRVADDEPPFSVEHGEAARHVVERDLEP